jgi:hypothetical protein
MFQPLPVLPIAKHQDSCYHCPFLYDDAEVAISRSPGFQGTTLRQVAQALLPVRSCRTCKSTPSYSVDIATGTRSNRKSGIRTQPKS